MALHTMLETSQRLQQVIGKHGARMALSKDTAEVAPLEPTEGRMTTLSVDPVLAP